MEHHSFSKRTRQDVIGRVAPVLDLVAAVEQDIGQGVEIGQRFVDTGRLQPSAPGLPERLGFDDHQIHVRFFPGVAARAGAERPSSRCFGPPATASPRAREPNRITCSGSTSSTMARTIRSRISSVTWIIAPPHPGASPALLRSRVRSRARRGSAPPGPCSGSLRRYAACSLMRQGCSRFRRRRQRASTSSEARRCRASGRHWPRRPGARGNAAPCTRPRPPAGPGRRSSPGSRDGRPPGSCRGRSRRRLLDPCFTCSAGTARRPRTGRA